MGLVDNENNMTSKNPFSVVKASYFTDDEINRYWVDIPGEDGFSSMLQPLSPTPLVIAGAKGSGKTHVMRWFSYHLQSIRRKGNLHDAASADGYVGIYTKCGALNSDRFSGAAASKEAWGRMFAYYVDIWLALEFIEAILDFVKSSAKNLAAEESQFCLSSVGLFDDWPYDTPNSIQEFKDKLKQLKKEIDIGVNNSSFQGGITATVLCSPGVLVYGLPKLACSVFAKLSDIKIIYLIDELENFNYEQQKYVFSLLRDVVPPCSIRVGVRTYGLKTLSTSADGEINREGDEFDVIRLDWELRKIDDAKYRRFALDLCVRRLQEAGIVDKDCNESDIARFFDTPPVINPRESLDGVSSGVGGKSSKALREQLAKHLPDMKWSGVDESNIDSVVKMLAEDKRPLIEKAAHFAFYQNWYRKKNLAESASSIRLSIDSYLSGEFDKSENLIHKKLSYFKADFVAQLYKEHRIDQRSYAGFDEIVKVSKGFPRHLLTIFKHIYSSSSFNGESPFERGKISVQSQIEGLNEASQWFFDEARVLGEDGRAVKEAVKNLADVFRVNRYSSKPTECSLRGFYTDTAHLDPDTSRILKKCIDFSLLIPAGGRNAKNSDSKEIKYLLNAMLAPFWELPIATRGTIEFSAAEMKSIFYPDSPAVFDSLLQGFSRLRNPPFRKDEKSQSEGDLGLQGRLL